MGDHEREMRDELATLADAPEAERRRRAFEIVVATVRKTFSLKPDEIAVLLLSKDGDTLRFAYPPELAAGGSNAFPVRFPSVAGRVVVSGESLLSNQVQQEQHLAFYERVPVQGVAPTAIQKLLAVPLRGPASVLLGVLEVSRRGKTPSDAGPDFLPEELLQLERLAAAAAAVLGADPAEGPHGDRPS